MLRSTHLWILNTEVIFFLTKSSQGTFCLIQCEVFNKPDLLSLDIS